MTWRVARSTRPPISAPAMPTCASCGGRSRAPASRAAGGRTQPGRDGGLRRPRPRRRRLGLRQLGPHGRPHGGRCRRRWRCASPAPLPVTRADPSAWPIARRRRGATRRPWPRTPSRCPSTRRWTCCLRPSAPWRPCPGISISKADYHAFREWKSFQATDGSADRAGHHARGCRLGGAGRRRGRPAAAQLPGIGRLPGRRLRAHPLARPRGAGAGAGRGGRGAAVRARAAAGPPHHRPAPVAAVPPDPRVVRPPHGARPRLRHGGRLRRHQLPDHGQARVEASATAPTS